MSNTINTFDLGDVRSTTLIVVKTTGFPLGFRAENTKLYSETATTICSGTRPGFCNGVIIKKMKEYKILENHPADSRVKILDGGVFQSLTSRMGTGGGNVPMIMEKVYAIDAAITTGGYAQHKVLACTTKV